MEERLLMSPPVTWQIGQGVVCDKLVLVKMIFSDFVVFFFKQAVRLRHLMTTNVTGKCSTHVELLHEMPSQDYIVYYQWSELTCNLL